MQVLQVPYVVPKKSPSSKAYFHTPYGIYGKLILYDHDLSCGPASVSNPFLKHYLLHSINLLAVVFFQNSRNYHIWFQFIDQVCCRKFQIIETYHQKKELFSLILSLMLCKQEMASTVVCITI